jgi:hypothetical protein
MSDKDVKYKITYKTCSHMEVIYNCQLLSRENHWIVGKTSEGNIFFMPTETIIMILQTSPKEVV